MKLIDSIRDNPAVKKDWKTQYRRYRAGRLKHQYWLWNRKSADQYMIDEYDYKILKNCQAGNTLFFNSSGYYLKDIFNEIIVAEQFPVVATFYPEAYICKDREDLPNVLPMKVDNFALVNSRNELWTDVDGLTEYLSLYTRVMNPGCRVFYSFRDTQIFVNRMTTDLEAHFFNWACSLEQKLDLKLSWHDIDFKKKLPDANGEYDLSENPDTTNGNLKFWFVYKGNPWKIVK